MAKMKKDNYSLSCFENLLYFLIKKFKKDKSISDFEKWTFINVQKSIFQNKCSKNEKYFICDHNEKLRCRDFSRIFDFVTINFYF